jgi:hypothetical protein
MFSKASIKAGVVRTGKAVGALVIAGLITQVKPICALIPTTAASVLATIGFPCVGVLGALLLGLEKTLTWKE